MVIPSNDELKIKLLRHVHNSPVGGHPGRGKTLEVLQREYYWPNMHDTIRRFVSSCHICRRAKASRETYHGFLKPLPIPKRCWKDILVDFIVELLISKGCINVMVVIDWLSKMLYLIGCSKIYIPKIARLFLLYV